MQIITKEFEAAMSQYRKTFKGKDHRPQTMAVARLLKIVSAQLTSTLNEILGCYGVNDTMFYALIILSQAEENKMPPARLSRTLALTRTSAKRLSDVLIEKGWAKQVWSQSDKRSFHLVLSKSGKQLLERMSPELIRGRQALWQDFSDQELVVFEKSLKKILMRLEEVNALLNKTEEEK